MNTTQPPRILVGICTCATHAARRQAVRDTWLRHIPDGIRCLFFTGHTPAGSPLEPDTVALSVNDGYKHLPQKTFAFLCHALENEEFDWLFKCDDDTYVALDRLASIIHPDCELIGDLLLRKRNAPSGGAGYMLSRQMVEKIVKEGSIPPTGAEDVIIGQQALKLGARPHSTTRLYLNNKRYPLPNNDMVTAHWCSPERLKAIDAFYRTSSVATCHGRHAHWNDTIHFHPGGYYRRTSTGCCGTYRLETGTHLALRWFDWPEENLAYLNGTYTGNKLVLAPLIGTLHSNKPGQTEIETSQPLYMQLGPDFNRIETTCIEAVKPNLDRKTMQCVFLIAPNENMEGQTELEHLGYGISHYPVSPEQNLTDAREQEFTSFLGRPPATCERRHVRSLRQSFANMLLDPSWEDDDLVIFGESDATPLIDASTLSEIVRQELKNHPETDVIRLFHRLQTRPVPAPTNIEQPTFEPYCTRARTLNNSYVWGTHALIVPVRSRRKVAELFTSCRLPIDTALEMAQSKNELNIRISCHDYFYQKPRTAKKTPPQPRLRRIAVCLTSYKRYEDLQRQIYAIMDQSYENHHLFVAVKGISEWAYINTVLPNFRHWIEEGRITMRHYPNKNQFSNFIDTIRGIDVSEYDLFAKIDDDDFYSRDYLKTVNDYHNTIPEGNSSYYSALSPIRYEEKGHVCFRAINYTIFGASMVLGQKVMQTMLQCEAAPEQEIPKIQARHPHVKRKGFGFAEDHLYHILMQEAGCDNRAEYIQQHCTYPHLIVQKSNKSVMRGGLLDQQFITRNRIVSTDPANHEHILQLHHPEWHDLLQIIGNRATRIARDDHADILSFKPDSLTVRWDKWGEETYIKQPSGLYLYQKS